MLKREHLLVVIVGLFLLSYLLDAVANPLNVALPTPYHFFQEQFLTTYPFTTFSVALRSLALFLSPLLIGTLIQKNHAAKGVAFLLLAALMQLYAVQEVATNAKIIPLEWSLSLSIGGLLLLVPAIWYLIRGMMSTVHQQLVDSVRQEAGAKPETQPEWLDKKSPKREIKKAGH